MTDVSLLSASLSPLTILNISIAVGLTFVGPQTPFGYYAPPVIPDGGVLPLSGPVQGGTLVSTRMVNVRTVGSEPLWDLNPCGI